MATTTAELEKRVRKVEETLAALTRAPRQPTDPRSAWYIEQAGRFANDPVFDEIVEIGRKARAAQRPKPRRRPR